VTADPAEHVCYLPSSSQCCTADRLELRNSSRCSCLAAVYLLAGNCHTWIPIDDPCFA
jgi:hypothetical protein